MNPDTTASAPDTSALDALCALPLRRLQALKAAITAAIAIKLDAAKYAPPSDFVFVLGDSQPDPKSAE